MTENLLFALLLAAAVGAGLVGGLFFAFSSFIMRAFDSLPPVQAITAMQSINTSILIPAFFLAFFGTAILSLLLAALALFGHADPAALPILIGALAYLIGTILVTMAANVPLNNRLARFQPGAGDDAAAAWRAYRIPWTRWNHVRTLTSLGAAAAFAWAG